MTYPAPFSFEPVLPSGRLDLVIDSDTGNETDDQFAIAFALLRRDRFRIRALISAPFLHCRVMTPAEGEFQSHWEQRRLLHYFPERRVPLWRGARGFVAGGGAGAPGDCEGARNLVALSQSYTRDNPLVLVGIATLTDFALALELDPTLPARTVLIWLGGQLYDRAPDEFNLSQDPEAAARVLNTSWRQWIFPCADVAEHLTLTLPEARSLLAGNGLGRFLLHRFERQYFWSFGATPSAGARLSIWDLAPFAFLADPNTAALAECRRRRLELAPLRRGDTLAQSDQVAQRLDRDRIFTLFAEALHRHSGERTPEF